MAGDWALTHGAGAGLEKGIVTMIDATGINARGTAESDRSRRSGRERRLGFTLTAISLAAACDAAPPSDDAVVSELSSAEVMALCDELRDAITADDRPFQCDSGDWYWVLPSNGTCLSADLSGCPVSVGEVRRCHALARSSPCPISDSAEPTPFTEPACSLMDACYPLAPQTGYANTAPCAAVDLSRLRAFDGVYQVMGPTLYAGDEHCPGTLPSVFDAGTSHFVLVSTEGSGMPEIILQSCADVADCQAVARAIQAADSPRAATPYNHLRGCELPLESQTVYLESVPEDPDACAADWPTQVMVLDDSSSLRVSISGSADPPDVSPGCGYIIPSSPHSLEYCMKYEEYGAMFVAPL
jgi:hypothetical protein